MACSGKRGESPFFLLGRVVMQQSYVCALIAMMVTMKFCSDSFQQQRHRLSHTVTLCPGLEHHIPQLVNLCAAAVGVSHLDPACEVLLPHVCYTSVTEQVKRLLPGYCV